MQAKAITLFSNLRARKVAAAKRHSSSTTSTTKPTSFSSPGTLHLFAFPPNGTSSNTSNKLCLPPQPSPHGPTSSLTLQHAFPAASHRAPPTFIRSACTTTTCASTIPTTLKPSESSNIPVLDISLLRETGALRSGKGTAITPRRGRKAQKVNDDDGSFAYQLCCYNFDMAGGEQRMARLVDHWEDMVSPKTVYVPTLAETSYQQSVRRFGEEERFRRFGFEFGVAGAGGDVPELEVDVDVDLELEIDDETTFEGSRKRSWEKYDADDETEEEKFDVEAWLDSKMESGDEEILYDMAKKAVAAMEAMGYVL